MTSRYDYSHIVVTQTHPPPRIETVAISEFKARCLALLERVRRTGQPLLITRHGKPVAEVVPPSAGRTEGSLLGSAAATARITGDIVSPASSPDDWEAQRS